MFTEYTNEEIEQPLVKAENPEAENFKVTSTVPDESAIVDLADTSNVAKGYHNNGQHSYDLDGESLW